MGMLGRAWDPAGVTHDAVTAPRVPGAAPSAPRPAHTTYLDGRAGFSRGSGRVRISVGAPAGKGTRCTALYSARVRCLGEEVVSALPFPPRRADVGRLRRYFALKCKGGSWLETHARNIDGQRLRKIWSALSYSLVCASFPPTSPLYTTTSNKQFFFLLILGKVVPCLIPPLNVPRPFLSGASPGKLTLLCRFDVFISG